MATVSPQRSLGTLSRTSFRSLSLDEATFAHRLGFSDGDPVNSTFLHAYNNAKGKHFKDAISPSYLDYYCPTRTTTKRSRRAKAGGLTPAAIATVSRRFLPPEGIEEATLVRSPSRIHVRETESCPRGLASGRQNSVTQRNLRLISHSTPRLQRTISPVEGRLNTSLDGSYVAKDEVLAH